MFLFLLGIHILGCIVLIVSILLQAGKGGGLSGAFGGAGSSGAVFGSTGTATFLSKVTTYVAVVFFLTCIGLWYTSRTTTDVMPETAAEQMLKEKGPMPLQNTAPGNVPTPLSEVEKAAPAQNVAPAATSADTGK